MDIHVGVATDHGCKTRGWAELIRKPPEGDTRQSVVERVSPFSGLGLARPQGMGKKKGTEKGKFLEVSNSSPVQLYGVSKLRHVRRKGLGLRGDPCLFRIVSRRNKTRVKLNKEDVSHPYKEARIGNAREDSIWRTNWKMQETRGRRRRRESEGGEKEDDMRQSRVRSLDEAVSQLIVGKWANGQMERYYSVHEWIRTTLYSQRRR